MNKIMIVTGVKYSNRIPTNNRYLRTSQRKLRKLIQF
jgi:hypothetical protein